MGYQVINMPELTALQAKEKFKKQLLDIPGVVGVGISFGSGERIQIYVKKLTSEIVEKLPKVIDGIPTHIIETGEIKALQRTSRVRPAPGGVSVGNAAITAGTLSVVVRDNTTGRRVILSNAHVLTADPTLSIQPETRILQQGVADGGTIANNHIANLTRWIKLFPTGTGTNIVDCAIATPLNDADVSNEILEVGTVDGTDTAQVDMQVMKSGRTSGLNYGTVIDINADIKVGYSGFESQFTDQIITSHLGDPGDSGSAVLTMDKKICGLLFAGSESVTVVNKINNVLSNLNISISGAGPGPSPVQMGVGLLMIPLIVGGIYMLIKGGL